jgi:cellulose synthase/poly-beta-1,6-N-acetylglucosamine synthase-like glycosyltransferase
MTTAAVVVFWSAVAFLVYAYGGFALVVGAAGLWRRRRVRKGPVVPRVSLIIAAYNEEEAIAARLVNALALDYPADRLEILVASDGSTDDTCAIVEHYRDLGVRLLRLPRAGKVRTLDAAVAQASGDVLVFSDANIMCDRSALRAMVENFADPGVGGVAGHTTYITPGTAESSSRGELLYWTYDSWLKRLESWTGSIVSAHGGLYAIRRELYRPVGDGGVTDDFAISTLVVEQGYRLVFEPEAMAVEEAIPRAAREFRRRVRLTTRGIRSVMLRRKLLNPMRYGMYAVILWSHKVARRQVPFVLVALAVASAWLWSAGAVYGLAAAAQLAFYALALVGWALRRTRVGRFRFLYIPFYYCMANAACAVAWTEVLRGRRVELWQPQRHGAA